jgi:hypothetical protein
MEQVVLLGDSLTQEGFKAGGWAARLAEVYVRRADVLNRVSVGAGRVELWREQVRRHRARILANTAPRRAGP